MSGDTEGRPKVAMRVTHDSIGFDVERTPEDEARADAINAQLREQAVKDTWTGDKHDPNRTPQELAGMIRADIAEAVRAGTIPDQRYVVSVDRRNVIRVTTAAYRAYRDAGRPEDGGPLGYRVDWTLAGKIGALIEPFNRGFPSWDFDSGELFYSVRFNDGLAKDRA